MKATLLVYAVFVAQASTTAISVEPPVVDLPHRQFASIGADRLVVVAGMVIAARPLRGTTFAPFMSALLLGGLVFLAVDGLFRGWLFDTARRVDQLVWVATAWAVAVIAVTGPGANLTTVMVSFVFGTLFALRIGSCERPSETVALSMIAVVIVSLVLSPLQIADDALGATWAYEHKNAAGRVLGLAVVILLGRRMTDPNGRFTTWFLLSGLVGLVMTLRTESGTVLLAIAIALVFVWFNRRARPDRKTQFTTPIVVVAAALVLVSIAVLTVGILRVDPVAAVNVALGRSTTNNTALVRFSLWSDAIDQIAASPLVGHGYTPYERGDVVFSSGTQDATDFDPTNLHNGYLQLAFSFGVAFAIVAIGHTFRRIWQNYQAGLPLRTALAVCMAVYGLGYSVFFAGSARASFFWALSMWAIYITPESLAALDAAVPHEPLAAAAPHRPLNAAVPHEPLDAAVRSDRDIS